MSTDDNDQSPRIWIPVLFISLIVCGIGVAVLLSILKSTKQQREGEPVVIRTNSSLKQIGICFHAHHDEHLKLPPGGVFDEDGTGYQGWQTYLLAYGEGPYDKVDFDLPWNAPENREAFCDDVLHYQSDRFPGRSEEGYARTHLAANSHVFSENSLARFGDIKDGLPNTIFAGEVVGDYLPWGHPRNFRDPALGINKGNHTFGTPDRDWCFLLMGDGSVRKMEKSVDPRILKALSTPDGGERVEDE